MIRKKSKILQINKIDSYTFSLFILSRGFLEFQKLFNTNLNFDFKRSSVENASFFCLNLTCFMCILSTNLMESET